MSGKVKNQHYVPRMYMKRFAQDQKRICVWNLMNDTILTRQRPENYAAKRYFYDTDKVELKQALEEMVKLYPDAVPIIDAADEQFIEKGLSREEADASKILELICNNHEALYDENNMLKLIIFLHDLAYRSEKYRDQLDNIREQTLMHLGKMGITAEQVEGMDKTGKDNQLYQLVGIAPLLKTAKELTENYNWYIGTVSGNIKLVISDNPAQGIMLGFNDICIPLSGDKAIIFRIIDPDAPIISKDMPVGNEIKLTERSVFAYNAVQMSYANRFMFGDKASLTFLKMLNDRQGGYRK
ncbi:DUF4238 domain-containing protein [Ruminococcus sp.]|mgnify:CR=1 FL=1|uniref:DUF4238 domain-containing protein n=1 Tax=Ruminococcus sp. TaxID=41978 RepID=UPI00351FCB95